MYRISYIVYSSLLISSVSPLPSPVSLLVKIENMCRKFTIKTTIVLPRFKHLHSNIRHSSAMLVFKRDRILVVLSTIGFARSYVAPRVGAIFGYNVRSEHQRVYRRRGCSTNLRGTNDVAGPSSGVGEDGDVDEWDTWEFGSWKVKQK